MKLRWLCAGAALVGASFAVAPGCSSDTPAAAPEVDAGGDGAVIDVCGSYTKIGDPCPLISGRVCFPMCATGGCKCVGSATGARWACTNDFSCLPDASPSLDGSDVPPTGGDDASTDAADDGATAADAGVDAATDAPADAPTGG